MKFISAEKRIYGKDGAVFVGISKNKASVVKKFLGKYMNIDFSIGVDNNAETYAKYIQKAKVCQCFLL